MTNTKIIKKAKEEIEAKLFAVTEQFLAVHEVVLIGNKPKVAGLDTESEDGTAIVYFQIVGEKFYLAIYLDTQPELSIRHVNTEPGHFVYFLATSKNLTHQQLSSFTRLRASRSWNKGDKKEFGNAFHDYSALLFEPNSEADEFEDKIRKLLDFLEQDRDGTLKLINEAEGCVHIVSHFHNGNTMLGAFHLSKDITRRLANLGLEINFDVYAEGNMLKA
jgi:hypothetical protein